MDIRGKAGESSGGSKLFKLKFAIVLIATSFFLYLAWYSYNTQVVTVDPKDLPLIEFNKKIKFKPGDPGGAEIANLDKGIYDYISGRSNSQKVTISSSREEAVSRDEMLRMVSKDTKTQPIISKKKYEKPKIQQNISYEIRIAKIKSLDAKDKACEIMGEKYRGVIGAMKCRVRSATKLGKKAYYLHYGPIASRQGANLLCSEIKKDGGACKAIAAR